MLRELVIEDLAVIERLTVPFATGLNVLSGETGAGKSMVLEALALALGGRADAEKVRRGAARARVTACFELGEETRQVLFDLGLVQPEPGEGLLVRRVVNAAGRSRAWVGPTPVPAATLRRLGAQLVERVGQHDSHLLRSGESHRLVIDQLIEDRNLIASVASVHEELTALVGERKELSRLQRQRAEREDYLRFVLAELEEVQPQPGEDERLLSERARLAGAEDLRRDARSVERLLVGGDGAATEALEKAAASLTQMGEVDPELLPLVERLAEIVDGAQDISRAITSYGRRIDSDPQRLEEVEDRLAELRTLQRKHRVDQDALVDKHRSLAEELAALEGSEERAQELEARFAVCSERGRSLARRLTAARSEASAALCLRVEQELDHLAMVGARFAVDQSPLPVGEGIALAGEGEPSRLAAHGADRIAFLLAANVGEGSRPLAEVASGGELSRILLALRCALAESARPPLFVFDEIDSGLSGEAAERVGDRLAALACAGQVLCITHLPQVAARAHHHLRVEKETRDGRTASLVRVLDEADRVGEIARMVAGIAPGEAARDFSRELRATRQAT